MELILLLSLGLLINLSRYLFIAGIPFLILYKFFPERFKRSQLQKTISNKADFKRDFAYSFQTTLVFTLVGYLFLYTPLKEYTKLYEKINDYPLWWMPVSILIALIFNDTYFYWIHRLVHHPRLFKLMHVVHHKSTKPSPLSSYSFNLLESILHSLIAPITMFIIPIHPLSVVIFAIVTSIINVYGHLGFEISPKWLRKSFLFKIVNTSVHHNLHHEKFHGNYGLYFRFWDKLLKTEDPNYVARYDAIQKNRFGDKN